MKLAIIIVAYRGKPHIAGLFSTLARYTDLTDVHIIAVDNASNDGTLEELERVTQGWKNVEILAQTKNTGFAGGNNIGIARARELGAPFVMLLNQDLELAPHWLEPLLELMAARPNVAAAQPLILLHSEPNLINSAGNELHFCGFGYCGDYRREVGALANQTEPRSVAFASGAALLLRMRALEDAGDFDESLFLYHEDCELQIRLRQRGYDCALVPTAHVFHKYSGGFSAQKFSFLERNRWLVLLKAWPLERLLLAGPALLGSELAVLAFAMKSGWLGTKLSTYVEILKALPAVARDRRRILSKRSSHATDGRVLTGTMTFDGFDRPGLAQLANVVLTSYWSLAHRMLETR